MIPNLLRALALVTCCIAPPLHARETLSLAGEWKLRLDPGNEGTAKQWFNETLTDPVKLPGSLGDSGYGQKDVSMGSGIWSFGFAYPAGWDWSKKGVAWYQKDVLIPGNWQGKRIALFMERSHWTQMWVDGKCAGPAQGHLSTPHVDDLSALLSPGPHRITVQVNTAYDYPKVRGSHHFAMQGRWNGVIGRIELQATDPVWIDSVQVYPDLAKHTARVRVTVGNATGKPHKGAIQLTATLVGKSQGAATGAIVFEAAGPSSVCETELAMGENVRWWSEFTPNLYEVKAKLIAGAHKDEAKATFGMREVKAPGRQFTLNGRPIFLRGNTDNAVFPQTAYPPMDVAEWKRLFLIAKSWGLNHFRFHSWCPPEAAFQAADETGFYLQPEGPFGGTSDNAEEIAFVSEEIREILDTYGNHPSFVMFSSGNEGNCRQELYQQWVGQWRQQDSRHLYTQSTNGGGFPSFSDFWVCFSIGRANWGHQGDHPGCLRGAFHDPKVGHINNSPPSTLVDYSQSLDGVGVPNPPKIDRPLVAHEVGQYNAYPNFREMAKYTGAVRLKNFEGFRKSLENHHMLDQADDFVRASGELQVLLYREEIEAALRTPGFAGFQLLALEDQQEQGTALCGILDAFKETKGYGSAAEFREWCAPVVPLLRIKQYTWTTAETFAGDVQVAHYGPQALDAAVLKWSIQCLDGKTVAAGALPAKRIEPGGLANLGHFEVPLAKLPAPAAYTVTLTIANTPLRNRWKIWLYPATLPPVTAAAVLITESWDAAAEQALAAGHKVLFLPKPSALPHSVAGSFATDFWCYPMFKGFNPPGTLGLLCDPKHPALADFPTKFHSEWQWWDLMKHSRAMILDDFPAEFRPLVQVIDNLERNQKLGALFEARIGPGRLMVCSINLVTDLDHRPVARQLRHSLLRYMASDGFKPATALPPEAIKQLGRSITRAEGLELAAPVGTHRATLMVRCGAKLQQKNSPWQQPLDDVAVKKAGFDYALAGNGRVRGDYDITYWNGTSLQLNVTCPNGWTGNLHLRLQDITHKGRGAAVSRNGKKLGTIKEYGEGAWVVVPLTAQDTATGKVAVEIAAPANQDVIVTDLVAMPTGASDPG